MHVELAKQEEVPPLEQAELPPMEAHHFDPTTGEDEFALEPANGGGNGRGAAKPRRARKAAGAATASARKAAGAATAAARCGQPRRSLDVGQGAEERALPVRLRQEIQALPRHVRELAEPLDFSRSEAPRPQLAAGFTTNLSGGDFGRAALLDGAADRRGTSG